MEKVCYSGDYVKMDEDGFLYFVGRRDTMIKSSGFRISPTEVEEVLFKSGLLKGAAVIGIPDAVLGPDRSRPSWSRGRTWTLERRRLCASSVPRTCRATWCRRRSRCSTRCRKTTSGKVDYPALRRREGL